jgi:hypothetical protein
MFVLFKKCLPISLLVATLSSFCMDVENPAELPIRSIPDFLEEAQKVTWSSAKSVHFEPKYTRATIFEALPRLQEHIANAPISDLKSGAQYIAELSNKMRLITNPGLRNVLDTTLLLIEKEYIAKTDFHELAKKDGNKPEFFKFAKKIYSLDPKLEICTFLINKELSSARIIRPDHIARALGYIERLNGTYDGTTPTPVTQETLSAFRCSIFEAAKKNGNPEAIIKAGFTGQHAHLVTYMSECNKEKRMLLYKELAEPQWIQKLKRGAADIQSSDRHYLLSRALIMQQKYEETIDLFIKTEPDGDSFVKNYEHHDYAKLLNEFLFIDTSHQIPANLLYHWIYNSEKLELLKFINILEEKKIIPLLETRIKSDSSISLTYPGLLGVMYASVSNKDQGETDKHITILNKAYTFLHMIKPENKEQLKQSGELWSWIELGQSTVLKRMINHAIECGNWVGMLNFCSEFVVWGGDNFKKIFENLYIMFAKNTTETTKAFKNFITVAELHADKKPKLLCNLAGLHTSGFKLYVKSKELDAASALVIVYPQDAEKAVSLYKKAAECGSVEACTVLGQLAEARGKVDEALDYYKKLPHAQGLFRYAAGLLKKEQMLAGANAPEAVMYHDAAKTAFTKLTMRDNEEKKPLLAAMYALLTHFDIKEEDPNCPYDLADAVLTMIRNIDERVATACDYINPKAREIMKKKADSLMQSSKNNDPTKQSKLAEKDVDFLATYAFCEMSCNRRECSKNSKTNSHKRSPDHLTQLTSEMKYATCAAKHGSALGKFVISELLLENSAIKNTPCPLRFFEYLYEVASQQNDTYAHARASAEIVDAACGGYVVAQAILIADADSHINKSFGLDKLFNNPKSPFSVSSSKAIDSKEAAFISRILTQNHIDRVDAFIASHQKNLQARSFMLNICYHVGLNTLADLKTQCSEQEFCKVVQNLEKAKDLCQELIHATDLEKHKEHLSNIWNVIDEQLAIHAERILSEDTGLTMTEPLLQEITRMGKEKKGGGVKNMSTVMMNAAKQVESLMHQVAKEGTGHGVQVFKLDPKPQEVKPATSTTKKITTKPADSVLPKLTKQDAARLSRLVCNDPANKAMLEALNKESGMQEATSAKARLAQVKNEVQALQREAIEEADDALKELNRVGKEFYGSTWVQQVSNDQVTESLLTTLNKVGSGTRTTLKELCEVANQIKAAQQTKQHSTFSE